jgi:hypothetical protein
MVTAVLAIFATAVHVASGVVVTVVVVVAVVVELPAAVELASSLDGGIVGQTFPGPPGGVNVVVEVPIRAPEHVQIPSPSSRLVLSQLKE